MQEHPGAEVQSSMKENLDDGVDSDDDEVNALSDNVILSHTFDGTFFHIQPKYIQFFDFDHVFARELLNPKDEQIFCHSYQFYIHMVFLQSEYAYVFVNLFYEQNNGCNLDKYI